MGKTQSELLFEELLKERGFEFIKGEVYFKKGEKCPDYYVKTKYGNIICEVKECGESELHKMFQKVKVGALSSKSISGPIREKIKKASKQLKPYVKNKIPMIVILSNPYGYFADLDNEEILSAMYGEIGISIPLTDDKEKEPELFFGRDGILTNQKEYISAVCVLEYLPIKSKKLDEIGKRIKEKYKDEEMSFDLVSKMAKELLGEVEPLQKKGLIRKRQALRLRVFHNIRANIKLPKEIFNKRYDELLV